MASKNRGGFKANATTMLTITDRLTLDEICKDIGTTPSTLLRQITQDFIRTYQAKKQDLSI